MTLRVGHGSDQDFERGTTPGNNNKLNHSTAIQLSSSSPLNHPSPSTIDMHSLKQRQLESEVEESNSTVSYVILGHVTGSALHGQEQVKQKHHTYHCLEAIVGQTVQLTDLPRDLGLDRQLS